MDTTSFDQIVVKTSFRFLNNTCVACNNPIVFLKFYIENFGNYSNFSNFLTLQYMAKFFIMQLMRFDGNGSFRNLKFLFEIEIFSQHKVSVLLGGFTSPPGGKYSLEMLFFQDGYLSKELISPSKTNGWTIYLEQHETKLSIFFPFLTPSFYLKLSC